MNQKSKAVRLAEQLEAVGLFAAVAEELRRQDHNAQVLTNALWKACGDNEDVVNATIESQGQLL